MATALTAFLEEDHREIDRLLSRSRAGEAVDLETYDLFRERLLRHIGWEEKGDPGRCGSRSSWR